MKLILNCDCSSSKLHKTLKVSFYGYIYRNPEHHVGYIKTIVLNYIGFLAVINFKE